MESIAVFSGEHDGEVAVVKVASNGQTWCGAKIGKKIVTKSDNVTALAAHSKSASFNLIAAAVVEDEESKIVLLSEPTSNEAPDGFNSWSSRTVAHGLDFPVRSMAFVPGYLVFGTVEGKVETVAVSTKTRTLLVCESGYGGVKSIAGLPSSTSPSVAVSFCSGDVVILDVSGRVLKKFPGAFGKQVTSDGLEKHGIACHPSGAWLAIGGRVVGLAGSSNHYAEGAGNSVSLVKWSVDGRFLGGIVDGGTALKIWEFPRGVPREHSAGDQPSLKLIATFTASASLIPLVAMAWQYSDGQHRVLLLTKDGRKPVASCPDLVRALDEDGGMMEVEGGNEASEIGELKEPEAMKTDEVKKMETAAESEPPASPADDPETPKQTKKSRNFHADWFEPFQPGEAQSLPFGRTRRKLLCWNIHGSVVRVESNDPSVDAVLEVRVDVESAPAKEFRIKDGMHGWKIASVGSYGVALAAKGKKEADYDEADFEELTEDMSAKQLEEGRRKKLAHAVSSGSVSRVSFRAYSPWGVRREWMQALPFGENCECLSVGGSVSCLTSKRLLRIYGLDGGSALQIIAIDGHPVTMASSIDRVFAVHQPYPGAFRFSVWETNRNSGCIRAEIASGSMPLSSPEGMVSWVGIAEDNHGVFSSDANGAIFGLYPLSADPTLTSYGWVPVLRLIEDYRKGDEGHWPVAVSGDQLCCAITRFEEQFEPRTTPLPRLFNFAFKVPVQYRTDQKAVVAPESGLILARATAMHTELFSDSTSAKKATVAHDKQLVQAFRSLVEGGQVEKAFDLAGTAMNPATIKFLLKVAATLGERVLEGKIDQKFAEVEESDLTGSSHKTAGVTATGLIPQGTLSSGASDVRPVTIGTASSALRGSPEISAAPVVQTPLKAAVNPFAVKKRVNENDTVPNSKVPRGI